MPDDPHPSGNPEASGFTIFPPTTTTRSVLVFAEPAGSLHPDDFPDLIHDEVRAHGGHPDTYHYAMVLGEDCEPIDTWEFPVE